MAANFITGSVDLDTLFAAHVTNNAAHATGYVVGATDIASRYDPLAAPDNANAGARVPSTAFLTSATGWAANTDLSAIFCGNATQYSLTTPSNGTGTRAGFTSPITLQHTLTVTFGSAAALTNYFYYGGRILISPSQTTGTVADNDLSTMLSAIGTIVIYDAGHYQSSGSLGTLYNATIGGSNVGTTSLQLFGATEPTLYTSNSFVIWMSANAAAGSATALTIQTTLTINTHGLVSDTYTGTYTNTIKQRNHPTQTVPTFSHTGP